MAATDGYVMTFTTEEILDGAFVTYDPVTGTQTRIEDPPQPVIAYEQEGEPLYDDEGPLRLVFLTPDPQQVVEGFLWVKWVTRIQMRNVDDDWSLRLEGSSDLTLDREHFMEIAAQAGNKAKWEDIQGRMWSGVPLQVLVQLVAGDASEDQSGSSGQDSAGGGYTVEIIGADGYTVTLDAVQAADPGYVVANGKEGNPLGDREFPLSLVGANVAPSQYLTDAQQFVAGITSIRVVWE